MEGVETFDIDLKEQKVTVKGNVQPDAVLQTVSKTGKKTAFWEEETPATGEAETKPAEAVPEAETKPAEAEPEAETKPAEPTDEPEKKDTEAVAEPEMKPAEAAATT